MGGNTWIDKTNKLTGNMGKEQPKHKETTLHLEVNPNRLRIPNDDMAYIHWDIRQDR